MKTAATVVVLILISLICLRTGNALAKVKEVKTTVEPAQAISMGRAFSQTETSSGEREKALKRDMLSAETYNERGVMYGEKGEDDLAISEFNKALEIYPMSAETYNNRGITYSKKGRYDLAISDFTKSLEIKPDAKTYSNRGITYSKKGQYDLAILDFTKSLEIRPDAKAYYNLGVTYVIKGQFNLALSYLTRCIELDPMNKAAYDSRGSILAGLACSDWGKACRLGNCNHLNEGVKGGLCIDTTENNPELE